MGCPGEFCWIRYHLWEQFIAGALLTLTGVNDAPCHLQLMQMVAFICIAAVQTLRLMEVGQVAQRQSPNINKNQRADGGLQSFKYGCCWKCRSEFWNIDPWTVNLVEQEIYTISTSVCRIHSKLLCELWSKKWTNCCGASTTSEFYIQLRLSHTKRFLTLLPD